MDTTKTPKELFAADIQKDLLLLEEQEGSVNFKFGVVYMKSGQKCDDEMLSNGKIDFPFSWWMSKTKQKSYSFPLYRIWTEDGSEKFAEFLGVLGEKIRLKGWERFRGGLDVKGWCKTQAKHYV